MAAPYATRDALKSRLEIKTAAEDERLDQALNAASRGIERIAGRHFNRADAPSTRAVVPLRDRLLVVPDFHTVEGLAVEDTAGQMWDAAGLQLEPLDGVQDGVEGWPYWRIRSLGGPFPRQGDRATVRVTARWGWAAVPADIVEATLIAAAELWKLKDAPLGVTGMADWGMIRVRDNPKVYSLVAAYRRGKKKVS
ncbi:hypothetical protein ACF07Q_28610 [Nocardiopsis dassonvillei]|uniref:hypothetical protein n=1 Tax=Nocardiopsis dassonvillei TaxID=2014 RepID=UPI0036F66BAA